MVFDDFLAPHYVVRGRMRSSEDLRFLLLTDGFSYRLFCDYIVVDLKLLETVLSLCAGHSLVFVCLSLFLSASSSVFAKVD